VPEKKVIDALVAGGQATGGPPLGPALGPLGVNVLMVINKINELTGSYAGMKVPVKITVNPETKEFDVSVGIPTTGALIVKESGIQKGSGTPHATSVGTVSMEQVIRIAQIKQPMLLAGSLKTAVKEVVSTCMSMGVTVDQKDAKAVMQEIVDGAYDTAFEKK
jgi:large subunit ribosomal protein L11